MWWRMGSSALALYGSRDQSENQIRESTRKMRRFLLKEAVNLPPDSSIFGVMEEPRRGTLGGIDHFMDTLMPRMAAGWPGLGNPELTPELEQQIVKGVLEEADGRSVEELAAERDEMLFGLMAVRAQYGASCGDN